MLTNSSLSKITLLLSGVLLAAKAQPPDSLWFDPKQSPVSIPSPKWESSTVYRATATTDKFSHHAFIVAFRGKLYVMWSSGPVNEDSAGQKVVYSTSPDGINWSSPITLFEDTDGPAGPLRRTAGGWFVDGERLTAYCSTIGGLASGEIKWLLPLNTYVRSSADGQIWSEEQQIAPNVLINEPPRRTPNGALIFTGEDNKGVPIVCRNASGVISSGWEKKTIQGLTSAPFPNEMTWYESSDKKLVGLFRDDKLSRKLMYNISVDDGLTWSVPALTNYSDATSKSCAGNIGSSGIYIINNAEPSGVRSPLTLATGTKLNGLQRFYSLRSEPTTVRFPGSAKVSGYSYPNAVVYGSDLFVVYSVNKEDIAVTRVPLKGVLKSGASVKNMSTRSYVGQGSDVMIMGFVVEGEGLQNIIIRALGPSLSLLGVTDALETPILKLFKGAEAISENDGWRALQEQEIARSGFAPYFDSEPAIVVALDNGSYTAQISGRLGSTGNAIAEVYFLP